MTLYLPFFAAFMVSLVVTPLVRSLSKRLGLVVDPRAKRWNRKIIPTSGGIAIFLGLLVALSISGVSTIKTTGLIVGAGIAFLLGLVDDLWTINPLVKLSGQLTAALVMITTGNVTAFFSSEIANILVTFFWLVAISNAVNLLDNMDGLASTTTIIGSGFLAIFFLQSGNLELFGVAIALAGSVLGFLLFNFPPASIFMGDSGSLFLGILLAGLAISREPQASNIFAILIVPALTLILPILDTSMVSITRIFRGQSPAVGGKDHLSHRLISIGYSERQVLFLFSIISIVSGLAAFSLEEISYSYSLVLIPILVVLLALFAAYLGQLEIEQSDQNYGNLISWKKFVSFSDRLRILQIALDFLLISFAYYLSFILRFGIPLSAATNRLFINSLPVILLASFVSLVLTQIYSSLWKYLSFRDIFTYMKAGVFASILSAFGIVLLFRFEDFSRQLFLTFPIFLFFLLSLSRFSFRFLDSAIGQTRKKDGVRILIYGAGDAGEFALREIARNRGLDFQVVGFVDDNNKLKGRAIHEIKVLGGIMDIETILKHSEAVGVIVSSRKIGKEKLKILSSLTSDIWIKKLRIELEDLE